MVKWPMILAAIAMLAAFDGSARAEPSVFKFVSAETALPKPPERSVTLVLEGTQLGNGAAEPAQVADVATGSAPASYAVLPIEKSGSTRHWLVKVTFAGDARLTAETRYVTFSYGKTAYALSYKVTERSYDWTVVSLATDVSLYPGEGLPISISTKQSGANGIHIAQSALVGLPNGRFVDGGWVLCGDPHQPPAQCTDSVSTASKLLVEANSDHTFWLRPRINDVLVGKYAGNVLISSLENPGGIKIPFTVYGTALWRQGWGVLAIVASIALAWLFGTGFRNRANRLQMLRPFAALRGRAQILSAKFEKLPNTIKDAAGVFFQQIGSINDALAEKRLTDDNIVPNDWLSARPIDAAEYKQTLATRSEKLSLLEVLMERGFQSLAAMPPSAGTAAAAAKLAEIADEAKFDPEATAAEIRDALALTQPDDQRNLNEMPAAPIREPTVREIDMTLREMSILTWIVVGAVATLLGCYILVLSNPGFGILPDYIFCVLWGFGLPAGAQQLGQATLGTVTTALRVTTPSP
jgi:hypothetical protein